MQRSKRGVYVERVMGDNIEITAVDSAGEELYVLRMRPELYEKRLVTAMEKLLDRADPTLKLLES